MIEDVLAQMTLEGFVVSNTFQVGEGDPTAFGTTGWKVYLRNLRNTRTGIGEAETLEGALQAALTKALEGPTYVRSQRPLGEASPKRSVAYVATPKVPILDGGEVAGEESLF